MMIVLHEQSNVEIWERHRQFIAEARAALIAWLGMSGDTSPNSRPVIIEGVRYPSCSEAAAATGIPADAIQLACQHGGRHRYYPTGAKNRKYLRTLRARYARKERP